MATTAVVGPPPGLSTPNEGDSSTAKESPSSSPNPPPGLPNQPSGHTDVNSSVQGNGTRHVYPLSFLLALSKSPLIERPSTMPPLSQWYGEWQPHYARGSHNAPHSPMGSFGKGDRHGRAEKGEHGHDHVRGGNNADEFDALGYIMRDSGFSKKERFRRGAEERERMADPMRIGELGSSKRFPQSGKNPFGQVSASGTFKPAGRESGPESPNEKRIGLGGRIGRDRDAISHLSAEERRRSGRDNALLRDKRRPVAAEDGEEWENVPRSPESERRHRAGLEASSDWRKGTGDRGKDRRGVGKTAFPAWMAEGEEPSWTSGSELPKSNKERSPDEADDISVDDVDTSGMDSIQAFKARMKEKERRLREQSQGNAPTNPGPPPGLQKQVDTPERSNAHVFDELASSAKQRAEAKGQGADTGAGHTPDLPGRASRFARFFDGKPQAAAVAAQQKQMDTLAGHSPRETGRDASPRTMPSDHVASDAPPGNMSDVFRSMTLARQQQQQQQQATEGNTAPQVPQAPPGPQRNPSEADLQSMQKIMALLSGQERNESEQRQVVQQGADSPHREHHAPNAPPPFRNSPSSEHQQHPPLGWQSSPSFDRQQRMQPFAPPPFPSGANPNNFDPRFMVRPGVPHGIPPHVAAMMAAGTIPPPPGMGRGGPPFGLPGFLPRPPPLPPHVQQQLASLPPQAQQHFLAQHFHANPPPFPPPSTQAKQHAEAPELSRNYQPGTGADVHHNASNQGASHLMALLGHGNGKQ